MSKYTCKYLRFMYGYSICLINDKTLQSWFQISNSLPLNFTKSLPSFFQFWDHIIYVIFFYLTSFSLPLFRRYIMMSDRKAASCLHGPCRSEHTSIYTGIIYRSAHTELSCLYQLLTNTKHRSPTHEQSHLQLPTGQCPINMRLNKAFRLSSAPPPPQFKCPHPHPSLPSSPSALTLTMCLIYWWCSLTIG